MLYEAHSGLITDNMKLILQVLVLDIILKVVNANTMG